ncbi:MAG: TonB-dependent receptor, partial [Gemmatimonadales bacterium]|nr:TonB-dependent receptor [Gemmatimonadales bacterium]
GTVTRTEDRIALLNVSVAVRGTNVRTATNTSGQFTLERVPAGLQVIEFRWLGYGAVDQQVTVVANQTVTVDASLVRTAIALGELTVEAASRAPERVVEAPAAVSIVTPRVLQSSSLTGQAGVALQRLPGVDVVQSGINDFNINARGLNSSLNRRILVLLDGRDLAIAFLGAQEWNGLPVPLEDLDRVEMARGPGSALYGANAFSGVVNMITPDARQVLGTKLTLGGGELATFRGDLRHAGMIGEGRVGYRINAGFYQSESFTRSRTGIGDWEEEYSGATDDTSILPDPTAIEVMPLDGQTTAGLGQPATGEADDLRNIYGSARFDYYANDGSVFSVDGGATRVENEVFVTGIGRVQVKKGTKPWARAAWAADRFNLSAWYTGRNTNEDQVSLASGAPLLETSAIFHFEGQTNHNFLEDRGRVVVGASFRNYRVDTDSTLMAPSDDDRSDKSYSVYGQVEVKVIPELKAVAALRYDNADLHESEYSPKAALVYSPTPDHSIRVTLNQAFQVPNYSEFFLRAAAGAPADFSLLEAGLRASPLGPALAGVPAGELFAGAPGGSSSVVPVLALGNAGLGVEKVTGWEIGYKGSIGDRAYVSVDLFQSKIKNFVTDLLPGVNPTYGSWTSPAAVPDAFKPALEQAVRDNLLMAGQLTAALGLTRVDGATAIVVSYTNAGSVKQRGIELGFGVQLVDEVRFDGSYTFFDTGFFEDQIKGLQAGDVLEPNTPKHKANLSLAYSGLQGLDAEVAVRLIDGYDWAAGIFQGHVPASQTVTLTGGYRINNYFRIHAAVTNLFDQERYHLFGGSVIGRRILGGVTTYF